MILSRSERARGNHGGVLFAANYSFYSVTEIKEVSLPEFNFTAALQIKTGNFYLLIVGVYYPPADSAYRPSMQKLVTSLTKYLANFRLFIVENAIHPDEFEFCIVGDFNLPDIDWSSYFSSSFLDVQFLNLLSENNLTQMVDVPTHEKGNVLDLVIVNDPLNYEVSIGTNSLSDHYPLFLSLYIPEPSAHTNNTSSVLSISSVNLNSLRFLLPSEYTLQHLRDVSLPNEFYFTWYHRFQDALSSSASFKRKKRVEYPFYYSSHSIHCLNKLNTLKRRSERCSNRVSMSALQKCFDEAEASVEADKVIALNGLNCSSTNEAFRFLKAFSGKKSLPSIMYWESRSAFTDPEKASFFNIFLLCLQYL